MAYEPPSWQSQNEPSGNTAIESPLLGPAVPEWSREPQRSVAAPTMGEPVYADPRLPFAPAPDHPMPSMHPAFAGATLSRPPHPLVQLAENHASSQPLGSHALGVVTIAVGVGAAAGLYYGGPFGGVAGSLFGGCAANIYRAVMAYRAGTPDGDAEAKVSATYAVLAAAIGGWVAYKFSKPRAGLFEKNPDATAGLTGEGAPPMEPPQIRAASREESTPCRPRHAYPVVSKACEDKP